MSSTFFKGDKHPLFTTVGIPYGFIAVENNDTRFGISSIEAGDATLDVMLDEQIITLREARNLKKKIRRAGLLENEAAIFQRIRQFQLPAGFSSNINFNHCQCGMPIPHGHIAYLETGTRLHDAPIPTLQEGLKICCEIGARDAASVLEVIYIVQQILDNALARDAAELEQRLSELPEELRRSLEDSSDTHKIFN